MSSLMYVDASSASPPKLGAARSLRNRPVGEHAWVTAMPSDLSALTRLALHGLPAGEALMEGEKLTRLPDGGGER